jgi:hypothetical protein
LGTYTPNLNLYKPSLGETGWDDEVNASLDRLDVWAGHVVNPRHAVYGAVGDGVADDTTALQAAGNAAAHGILFIPEGRYLFSTLSFASPLRIMGAGWFTGVNVGFGNAQWPAAGTGTVLKSTTTTGAAITLVGAVEQRYGIEDIMLLGPGSGTSIGVDMGSATVAVNNATFRDVLVANFATGYRFRFCVSCEFSHIVTRGCSTGISLSAVTNQNTFMQTEVQSSTVNAILATSGQAVKNAFYGGVIQNCTGTGINAAGDATDIDGFYFENPGITNAVVLAGTECALREAYMSTTSDAISVTGNGCRVMGIRSGAGSTISNSGVQNLFLQIGRTLADTGSNTTNLTDVNGDTQIGGAFRQTGASLGFYNTAPIAKQTSVPVTTAAVHAALVNLGLISA